MTANSDPERALTFSYAPFDRRAGLCALFALDNALGQVLRTTREPIVGQMRLAWWREALVRLDSASAPAEPVLLALANDVMPFGVTGAALAKMIDGWEPLLSLIGDVAIVGHAEQRGGTLFAQAGLVLGADAGDRLDDAGRGWALADLAAHLSDAALASHVREAATPLLSSATSARWSRNARTLGALAHTARMDLTGSATPWRVGRLAWHRLTGR
ncbi:squalene/phytoene synthase family protein [Sphingomonas bacterium]|uniref:squalene/phytoene synthase family protein n=1 Tax=Sphingomonas bacterium TaxID=1895847 RepID=UPI00260AC5FA|nr:squalene/phytoene synthase family protein [Sphingomonas bacterium]